MKTLLYSVIAVMAFMASPTFAVTACDEFEKLECVDGCQDAYPTDNAGFSACVKGCQIACNIKNQ